jgi:hypothetical protein
VKTIHKGACLCGEIRFTVATPLGAGDVCHCVQCRKWTGHQFANTEVPRAALNIEGEQHLKWFHSSNKVRRGFCNHCGSSLFFDPIDTVKHQWIGIALGAFESPTHTKINLHIFTAEKGDYYEITDGAKQNDY